MSARPLLCPHTQFRQIETLIDAAIELTPADIASEPLLAVLMSARKAFQYLGPLAGVEGEQPSDGPPIGPESYSPINKAKPVETEAPDHWPEERIEIACNASYQTQELLALLNNAGMESGGNIGHCRLLSVLVRLKELNGVVTSVLSEDESRETTEMSKVVFGEWPGVAA
jgi:hypothetical protein